MKSYNNTVLSEATGLSVVGAKITVFQAGTKLLATLFETNDVDGDPMDNPFKSDERGEFVFFAVDGRYDIQVSYGARSSRLLPDIELVDVLGYAQRLEAVENGEPGALGSLRSDLQTGSGAARIADQVPTSPAILTQRDVNSLSVDIMQFIDKSRWAAVRAGTSLVPEDDAFEAAQAWLTANAPFGTLRCSARLLKLNRAHTINGKTTQIDFAGPLDFRGLPAGTPWAIRIVTQPADEVNGQLDRRPMIRGLKLIGNGEGGTTCGIWYEDCNHLIMEGFGVRNFNYGIGLGANAYCIDHINGYLISLVRGFSDVLVGTNSGERITFSKTTFGGCQTSIYHNNGFGDVFADHCSFDYPNDFGAVGGTATRWIENVNGRVCITQSHFEGNSSNSNKMGGLSAFLNGGDGAYLTVRQSEVVFQQVFNQILVENNNPSCPVDFEAYMVNGRGLNGRLVSGTGPVNLTERNPQGGGATTNAGLLGSADNHFIDPNFDSTLRGVSLVLDGAAALTNPTDGTSIKLTSSADQNAGNGKSLKIQKIAGAGTEATFDIFCDLKDVGSLAGIAISFAKPGAQAGPMFLTAYYAAAHRNAADVLLTDRLSTAFGNATVNFPAAATPFTEYKFEGHSLRAPPWATHILLRINAVSLPNGSYYAGRVLMTEIG